MATRAKSSPINNAGPRDWMEYVPPEDYGDAQLWNGKLVRDRLVECATIIERQGGRVAPKQYGSAMPEYTQDWGDLIGQADSGTIHEGGNRVTIRASHAQMSRVEEALSWPARYLDRHEGPRRVLRLYLFCKAKRLTFTRRAQRRGWSKPTTFRALDRALTIIAVGLMRDAVLVRHCEDAGDPEE